MSNRARHRKAFGQHFLKDQNLIQKITERVLLESDTTISSVLMEVGPGKGAITSPVLRSIREGLAIADSNQSVQKLIIIEKDRNIAAGWIEQELNRLDIHVGDFLKFDLSSVFQEFERIGFFSNLPYSAGTAILNRIADYPKKFPFVLVMLQAEVAQRVRANKGTKSWGSLSLKIQNHWTVEKLWSVPPSSFSPPPKVNSEVILLKPRNEPIVSKTDQFPEAWDGLLRKSFSQRRKMLKNVLSTDDHLSQIDLEKLGIDLKIRAEALDWKDWENVFEAVLKIGEKV